VVLSFLVLEGPVALVALPMLATPIHTTALLAMAALAVVGLVDIAELVALEETTTAITPLQAAAPEGMALAVAAVVAAAVQVSMRHLNTKKYMVSIVAEVEVVSA